MAVNTNSLAGILAASNRPGSMNTVRSAVTADKAATQVSPAIIASRLGLSPVNTVKPPASIAKPTPVNVSQPKNTFDIRNAIVADKKATTPKPNLATLIPEDLDLAGRAGGARGPVLGTTATGAVTATQPVMGGGAPAGAAGGTGAGSPGGSGAPAGGSGAGGSSAGGSAGGSGAGGSEGGAAGGSAGAGGSAAVDAAASLDAAINAILQGDFEGFQGQRAAELRRLQNLRNQLFGDTEFGTTGALQRQQQVSEQDRRRLAARMAASGTLQGGTYAGAERGLGTQQRAEQDFSIQELLRPFREQTASDRLREFGLNFAPDNRVFNLEDMDLAGFSTRTAVGREAAARARQAALQQLAQRGMQI